MTVDESWMQEICTSSLKRGRAILRQAWYAVFRHRRGNPDTRFAVTYPYCCTLSTLPADGTLAPEAVRWVCTYSGVSQTGFSSSQRQQTFVNHMPGRIRHPRCPGIGRASTSERFSRGNWILTASSQCRGKVGNQMRSQSILEARNSADVTAGHKVDQVLGRELRVICCVPRMIEYWSPRHHV